MAFESNEQEEIYGAPDWELPPVVNAEELAEILKVNKQRIHRMAQTGKIPFTEIGKRRRYNPVQVMRCLGLI